MKTCSKCSESKPLSEFYKATARVDGLHSMCKSCANVSYAGSRSKKLGHYNQVTAVRRQRITERIRAWKEERGCLLCPETFGPCLQLHHLDATLKDMDPSSAAQYSWATFLKEAAECVVVCGNCHVKIHHGLVAVDIPSHK